jgi:hypothetical protein
MNLIDPVQFVHDDQRRRQRIAQRLVVPERSRTVRRPAARTWRRWHLPWVIARLQ